MPLLSKVLNFTSDTATGNEVYTGVGFQPKAILFFSSNTLISTSNYRAMLGCAVSTSQRWAVSAVDTNGVVTSTASRCLRTSRCIEWISNAEAVLGAADLVSMDSDGFTLNWVTVEASARQCSALCLGGSDLLNVFAGSFDLTTTAGTQAVTGVGFQPDLVILVGNIANTTEGPTTTANLNFGMMTAGEQWVVSNIIQEAAAVNNTYRVQRGDACYITLGTDGSTTTQLARSSLDAGGFTINKVSVPAANRRICHLCVRVRGARVKLGTVTEPASTGSTVTTGLGFPPNTLLVASTAKATGTSVVDTAAISVGAADSAATELFFAADSVDASDPMISDRTGGAQLAGAIISTSVVSAGTLNTYGSDGFTMDWTVVSGASNEQFYLAMGGPSNFGTIYVTGTDDIDTWQFTTLQAAITYMVANYPDLTVDNGSGAAGPLNIEISITSSEGAVLVSGFTTSATCYVNIYTTAGARHAGVWNTSKYRIEAANASGVLTIRDNYVRVDGLQLNLTGANANFQCAYRAEDGFIDPSNDLRISNTIAKATGSGFRVPAYFIEDTSTILTMWNCHGYTMGGEDHQFSAGIALNCTTASVYSCNLIGQVGLSCFTTTTVTAKNCYAHSVGASNAWFGGGGSTVTQTTCAASDTSATDPTLDNIPYSTATFTNVTGGSEDFRLPGGSALIGVGTTTSGESAPLNFTTDIAGTTRSGTWTVGAFTVAAAPAAGARASTYLLG